MGRSNTIALSETTKFIVDNRGKTAPTSDEGIALIATNCIDNKNLYPVFNKVRWVDKETYANWFRSHPIPGDILLTLKGSQNGAVCLVPDPVNFAIAQDMVGLRVNKKVIDPMYLFAALRSRDVQHQIKILDVSGVIPHLKKSDFDKLILPYPDIDTQKVIGNTYYSLCQKIDLLHRQNKTLEAMAETLFRQWFVEPARRREIEGGEAVESWEEGVISDIANHSKISVKPQSNKNLLYNHYSIPSYDDNKKPVKEYGIEIKSNKYQVINNTVLFSKLNPHKDKRLWLIQDESVDETHICSTEFQVVEPHEKENLYFIYGWLFLNDNYREIASGVGGTSGSHQRISPDIIFGFPCPLVPSSYVKKYNLKAEPIFQKQGRNHKQIQTLTNLRDTLLPKLMSGEVRVKMN